MSDKFDPASFGGGFGAGQQSQRGRIDSANQRALQAELDAEAAKAAASQSADHKLDFAMIAAKANMEIANRWIPYALTLRASIVAARTERQVLIDALRKSDPMHVDAIVAEADRMSDEEYRSLEGERLIPIREAVNKESEEGRLK